MPAGLPAHPLRSLLAAQLAGLAHGPAEALPVSSSAHVTLVTRLVTGRGGLAPGDPELAKATEVGAHAGTLAGLTVGLRVEIREVLRGATADPARAARTAGLITLASVPTALAAVAFERRIEERLGSDETIAVGLVVGGFAMALADGGRLRLRRAGRDLGAGARGGVADGSGRAPAADGAAGGRTGRDERRWTEATIADALALGVAQAAALWPGVSRSGAVLAAARARGFARGDAGWISAALAAPAVGGATALKTVRLGRRLARGTMPRGALLPLGAVTAAGALSGRLAAPLARRTLDGVRLAPFSAYRLLVAGGLLAARPRR